MGYGTWGRAAPKEKRGVAEKAFRRKPQLAWEPRWRTLSVAARTLFLDEVKVPAQPQGGGASTQPSVPADRFPKEALKELADAGFVEIRPARSKAEPDRVVSVEDTADFALRLRTLRRLRLLADDEPGDFLRYVDQCFLVADLPQRLMNVLDRQGISEYQPLPRLLARHVLRHRWPGWAAASLDDPLAERVVAAIEAADGPIPFAELSDRVEGSDPGAVRLVLDRLIASLAVVEDLQSGTWELMVGLHPAVREDLARSRRPRVRPTLEACASLRESGPEGNLIVEDLRAFLLEVAGEPPRVRRDHGIFSKDVDRFRDILPALPDWLAEAIEWTDKHRLGQALAWAHALKLVEEYDKAGQPRLRLAPRGQQWLAKGLEEQESDVFEALRAMKARDDLSGPPPIYFPGIDFFGGASSGDIRFLGAYVTVLQKSKNRPTPSYWSAKPEDFQALRDALDRAFSALGPGTSYRLESVLGHLAFGPHNPIHLGLEPDQVEVYWFSQRVPPMEEEREEAGRLLLSAFIRRRLIPLGCVATAIDDEGRPCVARRPRLDAYFGRDVPSSAWESGTSDGARVVVQPDFSVVVIGLDPAPAAALAPFCERTTRGGGRGAIVLKLTREAVVRAVAHGLAPSEIVARLRKHASNELPANVLREVEGWAGWVRRVTPETITVLRCPDRDTADRVASALKKQAERVNETLVAVDRKNLTAADRNKLREQGIIIQGEEAEFTPKPGRKKRRTRP